MLWCTASICNSGRPCWTLLHLYCAAVFVVTCVLSLQVVFGTTVMLMMYLPVRLIKWSLPQFLPYNVQLSRWLFQSVFTDVIVALHVSALWLLSSSLSLVNFFNYSAQYLYHSHVNNTGKKREIWWWNNFSQEHTYVPLTCFIIWVP